MKAKQKTYPGKRIDTAMLTQQFTQSLQAGGWKTSQSVDSERAVVQAQKVGFLRDIITADRALTFTFENVPEGFRVTVGVGRRLENIAIAAAEALLLTELFLAVDIPEMLWSEHVEKGIVKELDGMINGM